VNRGKCIHIQESHGPALFACVYRRHMLISGRFRTAYISVLYILPCRL